METMETTMVIKTNKKLRNEARAVAGDLGIPLTTERVFEAVCTR